MKKVLFVFAAAGLLMSCGAKEEKEEQTENNKSEEHADHEHDEEHQHQELTAGMKVYEETEWTSYGQNQDFDATLNISVDSVYSVSMEGPANDLVVKGEIVQVCQKAGCWVTMNTSNDEEMFIKFKDHFTIPIEGTEGKEAYIHGNVILDTTTVEMQKHYLDDRAEMGEKVPQEEYDAITEDKIQPMFVADGIWVIKN